LFLLFVVVFCLLLKPILSHNYHKNKKYIPQLYTSSLTNMLIWEKKKCNNNFYSKIFCLPACPYKQFHYTCICTTVQPTCWKITKLLWLLYDLYTLFSRSKSVTAWTSKCTERFWNFGCKIKQKKKIHHFIKRKKKSFLFIKLF
jgi:hypothetical protein